MRAMVIKQYGGPEVLALTERPIPNPKDDEVLIEVKALGLNRAELYMRAGIWGDVAEISGIECVGVVHADPANRYVPGQKVIALMGGMGRTRNGSYAELVNAPANNVVPIATNLPWEDFAAIPESYATAWVCLHSNLAITSGQTLVIRGASSALGRAAINVARHAGLHVIGTTRNSKRATELRELGAHEVLVEVESLAKRVRELYPRGVDAVLDIVGNSTILDSLAMARRGGRVCLAGLLDHAAPLEKFDPLFQMPFGGVQFSSFASAFTFGAPDCALSEIPFQAIIDRVAADQYRAKPAAVFGFDDIRRAHERMERNEANGKLVVLL